VTRRGETRARTLAGLAIAVACLLPSAASAAEPVFRELPPGTHAFSMTPGPEGKMWFAGIQTVFSADRTSVVGSIDPAGEVELFRLPKDFSAGQIAAGADGNLWVSGNFYNEAGYLVSRIGRITPGGAFTEFVPANHVGGVNSVTAGPDGAVWFTLVYWVGRRARAAVGRIDADGAIVKYPLPSRSGPGAIVTGSDGNLWFTERGGGVPKIGRITSAGRITHFRLPNRRTRLTSLVAGSDGGLWFGQFPLTYGPRTRSTVGRITMAGKVTQLRIPGRSGSYALAAGPGGGVWFTSSLREGPFGLGSINPSGTVTAPACLKPIPCDIDADALAVDADGRLWVSTSKYYSHGGGGGTGLMEGLMEEAEAGFVGFFP